MTLTLMRDRDGRDPEDEIATARSWLERVAAGDSGSLLRVYRPARTLAFGRLDAIRPGYGRAVAAARAHGFGPVLRVAGGHAAAFGPGCVGIDEIVAAEDPMPGLQDRFAATASLVCGALRDLGVDARVGEVPGEYCPGAWSVNARGRVKLAGIAQRVVRRAWLVATMVVVDDAATLAPALGDVYAALGLDLDPATIGGAGVESPRATLDAVEQALLVAYLPRLA